MIETKETVGQTTSQHDPDGASTDRIHSTTVSGRKKLPKTVRAVLVLGVIAIAAVVVWYVFLRTPATPGNIVTLSGRIEGDDSTISPKTNGRILEIRVREGDAVKAGDTIAILDDQQIRAREDQARATLTVAEAKAKSARDQIAVLKEQWQENHLQIEQARIDAEGRVRQAEAELLAAEADLGQQEAAYRLALFDKEAYTRLAETGAVAERKGKEAASTAAQYAAAVAAAKRRVEASRGAVTMAKANLSNPAIRVAGAEAVRRQIAQQEAEVASANAGIQQAQAQLAEAQANRKDLIVLAPFDGTVTTRSAEPGEVVTAGTAIVTLLDLSKVYLRGFIPEGEIGKVKLEQPARVYLDSNPNQPVEAYVSRIDPEATFTPENTYFRDDRVKQVVGVKLQLKGAIGFAKPGMPADGEVLVEGETWPQNKRSR
jgi:HlyD family secretion protein